MPIARFQMPDGRIARFEVPQGTTPEQAQMMMEQELANMAQPQKAPTAPTTLRDVGVAGASGVVGAAKSMTDFFGADNAASKALGSASTSLQGMYTPERQKEMQYYQELQDKAAKGGDTMGEIGAAFQGIKAAPLQGTVQAVGSLIPNLATLLLPGAGQARALQISRSAINTALGIVQGTGAVKGSLYEGVKQELIKNGVDEATAAKQASEAQSYLGPNYDQILLGAGIGYGAGKLGAEELLSPAVKGAARKAAAVASEAGTEALQGGQEQVAQNLGLTRAGMETPMFQGVAGAATQEGILGALGAGPVTMLPSRTPEKPKEEPLLLEYNFKPTPLPDGRVAMTRSELDQYEDEQFRKKYEAQPYERGNALAPDGSDPLRLEYDFTPTPLPDGTVAMTRSEVDAYLRRKREDEVNAPKRPELLDIIDKINARIGKQAAPVTTDGRPAMPTDTELNYATATQEVALLKKQKKTKERDARIAELEAFKQADGIAHFNRIARIDPKDAAKALEAGDISAFDYNRIVKSNQLREQMLGQGMDSEQSKDSANLFMQQTDRENLLKDYSPEIVEAVTPALNDIQELEAQRAILESSKAKKGPDSLWNILSSDFNKLSGSEIKTLSGKQNQYFALRASGQGGRNLRDLVSEDTLDDFLPPDLRSGISDDLDRINSAVEYIRNKIATKNYASYDTEEAIDQLDRDIGRIGEEIDYHLSKQAEPEAQQEEPDFTDLGEFDTGDLGKFDPNEYYPDISEEEAPAPKTRLDVPFPERPSFPQGVPNEPTAAMPDVGQPAGLPAVLPTGQQAPDVPFPVPPTATPTPQAQAATQDFGVPAVVEPKPQEAPAPEGRKPSTALTTETTDIIEGQMRVIDDETIKPQVLMLSASEQQVLADHYGEELNSPAFLAKVREDIYNFANKGAQAVASAIRDIIRKLHAALLATTIIMNPSAMGPSYQVALPENVTTVEQVLAKVPDSVKNKMSPGAQQAYANIMPAFGADLQKNNKLFIITDKPNARIFVFDSKGQPILDKKVLLGLQTGDYYKGDPEKIKANRITPAGLYTMGLRDGKRGVTETGGDETATTAGYDFNKVFVLDKAAPDGSYSVTLFHSVYAKMSDAKRRLAALDKEGAEDSRYSFGCINVDKDTYKYLLDKYEGQMDGAKLFIVPDNPDTTMDFLRGKAINAGDLSRQATPEVTKTVTKTVPGTPSAAKEATQMAARKEEDQDTRRGLYMEAKRGEKGMSKADVDVAVDRIKQTWENAPDIEVVQKISELPEEIQADIERDKVNPRGVYDPDTKKVWLVADNIPNDAQAAITLAHESFGHFGLRVALGKNFKPMMNSIYEGNKDVRSRADAYINDGMDKVTAVEEVLSEMAQEVYDTRVPENKNKLNILQKVMNAVRQFLARIGVPMKSISDAQVLALIANARRSVVRGGEFVEMEGGKALYSVKDRAKQAAAKATAAIHKAGQRRRMDEGLLDDLPEHLQAKARKTFTPENETIVTKVNGLQDKFWQKMAQGIVDQYRTIKDYTNEGYMLARMSKTIDGALEGMLFHGQAFLNGGALDIKSGTKGLLEIMAPLGKDVDRYQMWVALNREADITKKSQAAQQDIDQAEADIAKMRTMKGNAGKAFDKETKNILDNKDLSAAKKRDALSSLRRQLDKYKNDIDKAINAKRKDIAGFKNRIKAPSIDAELVAERDKFAEGMIDGRPKLEVYREVQREMNKLNRSVLNIALEQGLINKEAYDIFASDINYIPFYKMMEDGDLQGAATASGLGSQYFSKALEGGEKPFGDLMENTLRNWSHILSASMKNKAAAVTLEAASEVEGARPNLKVGLEWRDGKVYSSKTGMIVDDGSLKPEYTTSEGKGIIKVMIDGQPTYYKVLDDLLLDSVASIGYMGPKSKFLDVARDFKNILQFGVTLSPGFKVRNLFRDSIQAMAVSGLKLTPWANIVEGWAKSDRNNPAHISALAGGAIFNFGSAYEGDQSRMVKKLIKMGVDRDSILDTDGKIKAGLMKAWSAYTDLGNKSESANRMALYQQMRDKGMSHLEASFHARDLMDFSMQGSFPALRMVTQVVPFLNARLQGLYKLGRDGIIPTSRVIYNSTTGKPSDADDKMKVQQFSIVTGAVMMASMMLYLAFKDDEEFKKREEWDRDNFWWFRLPGMDSAVRIPKPFEIGAFGTMAERLLEQMVDQGAEGKQFEESIKRMLSDTFAMNPTPQLIKPMIDLYANKDSFTGAPIETAGMERLSKAERASDNTSPLAIALSSVQRFVAPKSMEMSPVQVDYAIKSYFGWLGGTVAASSHYAVMPFSKGAYPDHNWTETASMGFIKSLPATQSKYVTAFYENNKQISQAYADMRHYAELGDQAMVAQILEEKGDLIGLQKFYDRGAKDMAKLRQAITAIRNDETMDGAQKKEEIDRLKVIIGTVAEQLENVRKSIKK
jgi:hypothetical protein